MALLVSLTMDDVTPYSGIQKINVASATTLTEAQDFIDAYVPLIDAVTGAAIRGAHVKIPLTLPGGIKTDPMDDYFNRQGGNLSFNLAGSTFRETIFVPAYLRSLYSGEEIPNAGATAALITYLLSNADAEFVNRFDVSVDSFRSAELAKRAK